MEGILLTVITHYCVSACLLLVVIMMSEQVVPLAIVQCIIVKFLTNKDVKSEILMRLRAQLSNETLSRTQCMTGVSDLKVRKR
jgi:hypothetical protein